MSNHVCPWWLAYTFDNPLRRLFHKTGKMLGPYVREGMTVLDVGCGMGYFSIGMASMVGARGKVISVDIQDRMLSVLKKRAEKKGVSPRIEAMLGDSDGIAIDEKIDFALAFWMVHEVPDRKRLLSQLRSALRPDSRLLVAEPLFHVSLHNFEAEIEEAESEGFCIEGSPRITFSRTALLRAC